MRFGEQDADLTWGEFFRGCGEVDSVGGSGDGYVGAGVDEELCGGAVEGFEDLSGEVGEGGNGKVFLAELDDVDALGGPTGGLADDGGLLLTVVAGEEGSVGDGVAEHDDKCSSDSPTMQWPGARHRRVRALW